MKWITLTMIFAVGCSTQSKNTALTETGPDLVAVSDIHSVKFKKAEGLIKIEELKNEIKVTTDLKGLSPDSKLGFHIHEKGICEGPEYKTAGSHLNPQHHHHGRPESSDHHLGDLGNIVTNSEGESKQVILIPKESMGEISQLYGKSILIHAKADDLHSQPAGNSGDRIACGLIKPI